MIFFVFQKNRVFLIFSVHPTVVLLTAHAERFFVSRMRDLFLFLMCCFVAYNIAFMRILAWEALCAFVW